MLSGGTRAERFDAYTHTAKDNSSVPRVRRSARSSSWMQRPGHTKVCWTCHPPQPCRRLSRRNEPTGESRPSDHTYHCCVIVVRSLLWAVVSDSLLILFDNEAYSQFLHRLYGVMLCQGYSHYRKYPEDPVDLKLTVGRHHHTQRRASPKQRVQVAGIL